LSNTTGPGNTANGAFALFSNTTGNGNTANGDKALFSNTTGSSNTANGAFALFDNTTGAGNTATGLGALQNNTVGDTNTATGFFAFASNSTGNNNTASGTFALLVNTTGNDNTATGFHALESNTTGGGNTALGNGALFGNSVGFDNTAVGLSALLNTTGDQNTAIGVGALGLNTTGGNNIALGYLAGLDVTTANNVICIGAGVDGDNVNDSCFIGNIWGQSVGGAGTAVFVDSDGKLGWSVSSRRFKRDIEPMDKASEAVLLLKPVTFHYKTDPKSTQCFGLIAEEVAEVNPDLVLRDKNGELLSVRYDQVNAMLLNEFLKEHRKNEEQEAIIAQLKSTLEKQKAIDAHQQERIETLAGGLQKVSAQLEASKPAWQTIVDSQ
jgi:Chaperone of endosialidase